MNNTKKTGVDKGLEKRPSETPEEIKFGRPCCDRNRCCHGTQRKPENFRAINGHQSILLRPVRPPIITCWAM